MSTTFYIYIPVDPIRYINRLCYNQWLYQRPLSCRKLLNHGYAVSKFPLCFFNIESQTTAAWWTTIVTISKRNQTPSMGIRWKKSQRQSAKHGGTTAYANNDHHRAHLVPVLKRTITAIAVFCHFHTFSLKFVYLTVTTDLWRLEG